MKEPIGKAFSLAAENAPVPGCTVSKQIFADPAVTVFSLAENTDISAEIYEYPKFLCVLDGCMTVYGKAYAHELETDACIVTPTDVPVGVRAETGAVYLEITLRRRDSMNQNLPIGEAFTLDETLPYSDGKIVNKDLFHNEKMKFVVMAFDAGTGLSEHAAPGEAMVFALDGEGVIGYEGQEHTLHAGETFCFAKGGKHFVKAKERFKMALLLILD